jgi:SAM-dependent methyltransferase
MPENRCPICDGDQYADFGGRPGAVCLRCGSLERHRALAKSLDRLVGARGGEHALEVAPLNPTVFGWFLRDRGWRYTSIDQSRRGNPHDPRDVSFIDMECELEDLAPFAAGSVDLIVLQHVIEEIPEYGQALSEIARVLALDGVALLEIPFDATQAVSVSQAPNHFGNVWRFGRDLVDAVQQRFASVQVAPLTEGSYAGQLFVCRR